MAQQDQILAKLTELIGIINAIRTNAKKIDELPEQTALDLDAKIHISIGGVSYYLKMSRVIDAATDIPFGDYTIYRADGNSGPSLQSGDVIIGKWSGTAYTDDGTIGIDIPQGLLIKAEYNSGNKLLIPSYTKIAIL